MKLGVNVDHVATLRNLRGTPYPSLLEIAQIAIENGADFITVHLREDRRHVRDEDLYELKKNIRVPINLEMAATDEMLAIAKDLVPAYVSLVPEKRMELTTETGLDAEAMKATGSTIISQLQSSGIKVVLFLDPDAEQIAHARELKADKVELHVGSYCLYRTPEEFERIVLAAKQCVQYGIECHAGHGIDYINAVDIATISQISAINVGHFLICEALRHGIGPAVRKMKDIISRKK